MKKDERPIEIREEDGDPPFFFKGVVDVNTSAYFMKFPISMDTLMQVADINVEFFHVRFVLNCLIRGLENNLMACLAGENLVGLLYLTLREQFFKKIWRSNILPRFGAKHGIPKASLPNLSKGWGLFS